MRTGDAKQPPTVLNYQELAGTLSLLGARR